jgi:release factor glutamine methyltransferase
MRSLIVKIIHPFIRVFAKYYFAKPRKYNYKNIKGIVNPNVFHPQFTISTRILLDFIDKEDLEGKRFLELGCGTGLISTYAAYKGAKVLASDVNNLALKNAELNAKNNHIEIETVNSDLFKNISHQVFDFIIINPPYYPKQPKSEVEKAWFCGEDFEYFKSLFSTIQPYFNQSAKVIMILSEDCDIERIKQISSDNNISFTAILETKKWGEKNYLFQLKSI